MYTARRYGLVVPAAVDDLAEQRLRVGADGAVRDTRVQVADLLRVVGPRRLEPVAGDELLPLAELEDVRVDRVRGRRVVRSTVANQPSVPVDLDGSTPWSTVPTAPGASSSPCS